MITPNLDELETKEFTPIANGTYPAKVASVEVTTSSNNNPQLKVVWQLFGDNHSHAGSKVWEFVPLSGKGIFVLHRFHKALTGEELAKGQKLEIDEQMYVGRDASITVEAQAGSTFANVKAVVAI